MWSPNQSNLNQNPTAESLAKDERISHQTAEVDQSIIKLLILGLASLLVTLSFSYFIKDFIFAKNSGSLYLAFIFLVLILVFAILNALCIKSSKKIAVLLLLIFGALIAPFYEFMYPVPSWTLIFGAILTLIFIGNAYRQTRSLLKNSLTIQFFHITARFLPIAMTGILLFLSTVLYVSYFERGVKDEVLAKGILGSVLKSSDSILRIWFPDFSSNQSTGELINMIAGYEVEKLAKENPVALGSNKSLLVNEATKQVTKTLEGIIGKFDAKESIVNTAYKSLTDYFNKLSEKTRMVFGGSVALLFFFTLKGFAVFSYWLIALFSYLLFKLLLILNFFYIGAENQTREFVVLP